MRVQYVTVVLRENPSNISKKKIFDSLHDIDPSVLKFQEDLLTNILSFGCDKCEETVNKKTLQSTVTYRKSTNHLKRSQIDQ